MNNITPVLVLLLLVHSQEGDSEVYNNKVKADVNWRVRRGLGAVIGSNKFTGDTWKEIDKTDLTSQKDEAVYGVFFGFMTCVNVVCHPVEFVQSITDNLLWVSDVLDSIQRSAELFKKIIGPLKTAPFIGRPLELLDKGLDLFIDILKTVKRPVEKVKPKVQRVKNATEKFQETCTKVRVKAALGNAIVQRCDEVDGTNLQAQLRPIANKANDTCFTILGPLDKLTGWIKEVDRVRENNKDIFDLNKTLAIPSSPSRTLRDLSSVVLSRQKRLSTYDASGALGITDSLNNIAENLEGVIDVFDVLQPIINIINKVENVINDVLTREICIPLTPFGTLLGDALNISADIINNALETASAIAEGRLKDAAELLFKQFGDIGDVFKDRVAELGESLINIVPEGLKDVLDLGRGVGETISNVKDKITGFFGKKRRKRQTDNGWEKEYIQKNKLQALMEHQKIILKEEKTRHINGNRRKRDVSSLTADLVTQLGDFISSNGVCITLQDVLDGFESIVNTILAPFKALIDMMLQPIVEELKRMFLNNLPDVSFILDLNRTLNTLIPGQGLPTIMQFNSFADVIEKDKLLQKVSGISSQLDSTCLDAISAYTGPESPISIQQLKCACIKNCGAAPGITPPDTPPLPPLSPSAVEIATLPECIDAENDPEGLQYIGKLDHTEKGDCLPWNDQSFKDSDFPDVSVTDAQNFCRNVRAGGVVHNMPWCFVITEGEKIASLCTNIPTCGTTLSVPQISSTIPPEPEECRKTVKGEDYIGTISVTAKNQTCIDWESFDTYNDEDFPENNKTKASNFCRNPKSAGESPFCYALSSVDDNGTIVELPTEEPCSIPICDGGCKKTVLGTEYSGSASLTVNNRKCQRWGFTHPHIHSFTGSDFPNDDNSISLAENFCRNPDNKPEGPWCFTEELDVEWEYCNVPLCKDHNEGEYVSEIAIYNWEFVADLLNPSTDLFKNRSAQFCEEIMSLSFFDTFPRNVICKVLSFRPGSTIVKYSLTFERKKTDTDDTIESLKQQIEDAINDGLDDKNFLSDRDELMC